MRKIFIVPLDGFSSGDVLLSYMDKVIGSDISDLIAYFKFNDAVHNPDIGGPRLVDAANQRLESTNLVLGDQPAEIFLDLKILDVSATLLNILKKYAASRVGILTVSTACSVAGIYALRMLLPNTKLAAVSVPTDFSVGECVDRYGMAPSVKIFNDVTNIRMRYQTQYSVSGLGRLNEPFDLVVCSAHELRFLKKNLPDSYGFIVPGIRDEWMKKPDEHQERKVGIKEALELGATYVVMGAQLTKGNPFRDVSPEVSQKMTIEELSKVDAIFTSRNPLEVLRACGGYYKSPVDNDGHYAGPLVAYAGTYETVQDNNEVKKNYVGFEYFNFAAVESLSSARTYFATLMAEAIINYDCSFDAVVGAPMGGILLSGDLSRELKCRSLLAEKKVEALADPDQGSKEKSQLVIDRHEIRAGDNIILVEDVCNNFSTTAQIKGLIEKHGANLVAIVCAFNRSGRRDYEGIPVLAAWHIPSEQYRQDEDRVRRLVAAGKVVWKPKFEWKKLQAAMG